MKLSDLNRIENNFQKLSDNVYEFIGTTDPDYVSEADHEKLRELNLALVEFNTKLLDLKVINNSKGGKILQGINRHLATLAPEVLPHMAASATESTLALEFKDSAFGVDLSLNEYDECINERLGERLDKFLDLDDNENPFIQRLSSFEGVIFINRMDYSFWGTAMGIRIELGFTKQFFHPKDEELNIAEFSGELVRFLKFLENYINDE